jgi:hypothetical protein
MMKSRFTDSQIIAALKPASAGPLSLSHAAPKARATNPSIAGKG